jgi:predicted neutral ceramidase superfamily lipid hydrolase
VVYWEDQWWGLEKFMNIRVPLKALHFMTRKICFSYLIWVLVHKISLVICSIKRSYLIPFASHFSFFLMILTIASGAQKLAIFIENYISDT